MHELDFIELAPQVGLHLLGKPTQQTKEEIRWGTNGSWCLNLNEGLFYSFELGAGGGVIWLIDHFNQNRKEVLEMFNVGAKSKMESISTKDYKKFDNAQMKALAKEAKVILTYSDSFVVMRFSENHSIKQKYAPFSKQGDFWFLKRPEGLMPIYYKEGDGPIIINEGEKATKGCQYLYDGPIATWHGGVNSWKKSDWTIIFEKDIIIWPDNDDAGKSCAKELAEYLSENGCNVHIAKIPNTFQPKDDLWDAYEQQYFNKESFKNYVSTVRFKARRPSLTLRKVSELITEIREPEWVIKDIMEKDSVLEIYGAPKSGKSFIAIDMALCASMGIPWHDHETYKTPIIYLAGEGQRGIARRVQAWEHYTNHFLHNADLFISDRGVRLLDEKDHQNLIDHIYSVADKFGDIGCIVVDTLARNFGAGNENSTEDMNLFIERVDHLKNEFNACIALVHHTGHSANGRARGSSVLPAAVDAEFAVKRQKEANDEMRVEFVQTLIKDGTPMAPKFFQFKEIDLLGYPGLTSGVLVPIDADEYHKRDDSAIDQTALLIAELQKKYATMQDIDPINIWVKQKDIIDASDIGESAVKQRLKRLRESGKIHYEERRGYQSKMFDEIK